MGGNYTAIIIILIVFGAIFGSRAFNNYIKSKERMSAQNNNINYDSLTAELAEQRRINKSFEKRIQVLESIVTDESYDLKEKFKDL